MTDDLPFRIVILLLAAGMRIVRWRSRPLTGWNAAWPALKKDPADAFLVLACRATWTAAVAVYVLLPHWISACRVPFPVWLRWAGLPLGVAAVWMVGWADRTLGNNLSVALEIKRDQTLVTNGPYRWVRHPIYTAGLVFCSSLFLVSANGLVGACCLGGTVLLYATRIPKEEKMMIRQFGDQYRQYAKRSGRLLPRILRGR
jgi:protein-S-isoprenylcysteine O-methyltransferase Ste14